MRFPNRPSLSSPWLYVQLGGFALLLALIGTLVQFPGLGLHLLWDVAIPIVPAVLLIAPALWRNACPIAFANSLPRRASLEPRRRLRGALAHWAPVAGIGLLYLLVPARRLVFNADGPALALTIVVVLALAVGGGILFSRKAGFCASICPVLPVERLYGQQPWVDLENPYCPTCNACVVDCWDLSAERSLARLTGLSSRPNGCMWMRTPLGLFAASFPGFVLGYYTVEDGSWATAPAIYAHVVGYAAASAAALLALVWALKLTGRLAVALFGTLAFGVYYSFAGPVLARSTGIDAWLAPGLVRIFFVVLAVAWFARRVRWLASQGQVLSAPS